VRYLAAGLFFDFTKTFNDGFDDPRYDLDALNFSMGLALKNKIPL